MLIRISTRIGISSAQRSAFRVDTFFVKIPRREKRFSDPLTQSRVWLKFVRLLTWLRHAGKHKNFSG